MLLVVGFGLLELGQGLDAVRADLLLDAVNGLGLEVDVLPLQGPDVGMGAGSAARRGAAADVAFFRHTVIID